MEYYRGPSCDRSRSVRRSPPASEMCLHITSDDNDVPFPIWHPFDFSAVQENRLVTLSLCLFPFFPQLSPSRPSSMIVGGRIKTSSREASFQVK